MVAVTVAVMLVCFFICCRYNGLGYDQTDGRKIFLCPDLFDV
jgi:hypothetical protein